MTQKRINKAGESRNTVQKFIYTDWIDLSSLIEREKEFINNLNIKNLSFINFCKFYLSFVDNINLFNASRYNKNFKIIKDKNLDVIKRIGDEVVKLDIDILNLKNEIKKVNFNRKVALNIKTRKIEEKNRV